MAPKCKLTYFNGRGLAEIVRLIFAQAGVEYEDVRIEKNKWAELKPTMPFGKVPILEVDGEVISESRAIARYVAKENGLAGKNSLEAAKCDMIIDALYDLFGDLGKWSLETDESVKATMFKKFAAEALPPFLVFLNPILEKNNGGAGFIVGDQLTWADIALAHGLHCVDVLAPAFDCNVFEKYPVLKAYITRIVELPNIKAWLEKRPASDF